MPAEPTVEAYLSVETEGKQGIKRKHAGNMDTNNAIAVFQGKKHKKNMA